MVPHRKALRAIALVSYCANDTDATRNRLCLQHCVQFPTPIAEFWQSEIDHWLTPAMQAAFMTTDTILTSDVTFALKVAEELGVAEYIHWTSRGLDIAVSDTVLKWRKTRAMRLFLETMILCGLDIAQIQEDMRRMYGVLIEEAEVRRFAELYCDREFALGDNWFLYTKCIGEDEAQFKVRMMAQNRDYVRWKMGVPISLDSDVVLDRMMSDGYFTCQTIKAETDNQLSKDDLVRVKMERDTIFKCMDRKIKFKEASGGGGTNQAVDAIGKIALKYVEEQFVLKEDLLQQQPDA